MKVYFGDFDSRANVERQFEVKLDKSVHIKFAVYESGWEGSAAVVFEQDGKLYLVEGSHCSCYGLEGQWEPTEETLETLARYHLRAVEEAGVSAVWQRRFGVAA